MLLYQDDVIKVLLAIAVGGVIGIEREFRDKAAGFRTLIFICVGATLFTIFSLKIAGVDKDPGRIAAQIVTGVGFLGAGVILREGGRVIGLTTAATIWLTAALGVGLGIGEFALVGAVSGSIVVILWFFQYGEQWIDNLSDQRTYQIVCRHSPEKFNQLEMLFKKNKVRIHTHKQIKKGEDMIAEWETSSSPAHHEQMVKELFADSEVKEFKF